MKDSKERRYELPLDGKLVTGDDPCKIGPNFQSLVNLRYSNKHPKAIGGMTKINSSIINSTYLKVRNGIHYRKDQPSESHLLVEAHNTGLTARRILQNTTSIPTAGNFSATELYTPTASAGFGRWSPAPNGDVAYCNGSESCIYGGDEMEISGFVNYYEVAAPASETVQTFTVDSIITDVVIFAAEILCPDRQVLLTTTGTLPAGLSEGVVYYIRQISATEYTFHTTYLDALRNINIVDITDTGSGVHTATAKNATVSSSNPDGYEYTDRLQNTATDADNTAVLYTSTDNKLYFYIGATRPMKGFKLYSKVANSSASTMTAFYWNGTAWASVAGLVDGTSVGGKSLAVTGSVTFTDTVTTAKLKYIKGAYIYWYRVILSAASAGTSITHATANCSFQALKDIWSGENYEIDSFKVNYSLSGISDATIQVRENKFDVNDGGTYADLSELITNDSILCGFQDRMTGCSFSLFTLARNETANSAVSVFYWSGKEWVTVGPVDDGTLFGTVSFGQTGTITWDTISAELESQRNFENGPMLYYYKFSFAAKFSDAVNLYWVTGIPAQKNLNSYKFPLLSNNRLFLCCNNQNKKNSAICSAVETSVVFNGNDSVEHLFGDDSELIGGAWIYSQFGSSLFNVTLFFKRNETWALVGKDPEDWTRYRVSGIVGCTDPETIRVVDLGVENVQGLNRNIAIWRSADGIVISDGRTPIDISNDIKDVFDKRSSTFINNSVKSSAFWDSYNKEYHWLYADGSSTTLNKEKVFSFIKMGWFDIDRTSGKALQVGIEVQDTSGINYDYGFIDTGYCERLEYGNTFDGAAISSTMQLGDMAIHGGNVSLETTPQYSGLIAVAKTVTSNTVAVSHYGNGSSTANETWTITPTASGKRIIIDVEHRELGRYIFHSWKFVMSTSDEAVCFEPLYFYVLYDVIGDHTRDRG